MADELTTTTTTETTSTEKPWLDTESRMQSVKDMYTSNLESQKAQLKSAYDQSVAAQEQSKQEIGQNYRAQQEQAAANYERNRRNQNMAAAVSGLNTGANSQMQLGLNTSYNNQQSALAQAQAQQEAAVDRELANIETNYANSIAQAVANNDYQLAAALLDEMKTAKSDAVTQAQTLAQYGIFSGYNGIYSNDQIKQMQKTWLASNNAANGDLAYTSGALDEAYNNGTITAKEYKNIHGSYPANSPEAQASSGGGYYYGGGSGSGSVGLNDVGSYYEALNAINSGTANFNKSQAMNNYTSTRTYDSQGRSIATPTGKW